MRARITFSEKVFWNHGNHIAWTANVQGCPERSMWTLVFTPEYALNEVCFEGRVKWLAEPTMHGIDAGTRFTYLNPDGRVIATGEVL